MASKLAIGRYIPIHSPIHRLDPRVKLFSLLYLLVIIFFANNWASYAVLFAFSLIGVLLSRISLRFFLRSLRPLFWVILLTVVVQLFVARQGEVLVSFGPLAITTGGIINSVFILLRFMFIIFISTLLTFTTTPLELTDGIETAAGPLKKVLPVHEFALMLSIALRFVPTLVDETEKIMDAQRARGSEFSEGGLIQRIKAIIPILIPLFISAFDRAFDLSVAMEARGYRSNNDKRTKYRVLDWDWRDTVAMLIVIAVGVLAIVVRAQG